MSESDDAATTAEPGGSRKRSPTRKAGPAGTATKIAAYTALVAALGSLLGSVQSLVVSMRTSETQERIERRQSQIEARQDTLNHRDRLTWENTRIGNLWIGARPGTTVSCGAIPVDEVPKWDRYCGCLFGEPCTREHNFRQVKDQERLSCAVQIGTCRVTGQPAQ